MTKFETLSHKEQIAALLKCLIWAYESPTRKKNHNLISIAVQFGSKAFGMEKSDFYLLKGMTFEEMVKILSEK